MQSIGALKSVAFIRKLPLSEPVVKKYIVKSVLQKQLHLSEKWHLSGLHLSGFHCLTLGTVKTVSPKQQLQLNQTNLRCQLPFLQIPEGQMSSRASWDQNGLAVGAEGQGWDGTPVLAGKLTTLCQKNDRWSLAANANIRGSWTQ